MIGRLRRRLAHALDRRFVALHHRVEGLEARVDDLARADAQRDAELRSAVDAASSSLAAGDAENRRLLEAMAARLDEEVTPALKIMAGNDAENRRLLDAARGDPDYERAFVDPEPLVTVIVTTRDRPDLLRTRALPSVLAQTHERLEVLVIGDATDGETEAAVWEAGDPRVTFVNLTQRYVYPDPQRHWFAAATLTRNEGYRLARGHWLVDLDDDDAMLPEAIASLLAVARERNLEAVQGVMRRHAPDGGTSELVFSMPHHLSLNGAVVHSHLRFFGREHVAAAFGIGGDVFRGERMLRAGVRIGLLDRVTYEYYPSLLWQPR
jgi:Glycosyl transferase family 2